MKSVPEIEMALRQLPPRQQMEIAHRILDAFRESSLSGGTTGQTLPLPDYSARRRRIFGAKVLPNMVLAARAEERW